MNSTILKIFMCLGCLFSFQLVRAQDATSNAPQAAQPSVEETLKWLQQKIGSFAGYNNNGSCSIIDADRIAAIDCTNSIDLNQLISLIETQKLDVLGIGKPPELKLPDHDDPNNIFINEMVYGFRIVELPVKYSTTNNTIKYKTSSVLNCGFDLEYDQYNKTFHNSDGTIGNNEHNSVHGGIASQVELGGSITISLGAIDPDSVVVKKVVEPYAAAIEQKAAQCQFNFPADFDQKWTHYFIDFSAKDPRIPAVLINGLNPADGGHPITSISFTCNLCFKDKDMAERVAKAIKYLAQKVPPPAAF